MTSLSEFPPTFHPPTPGTPMTGMPGYVGMGQPLPSFVQAIRRELRHAHDRERFLSGALESARAYSAMLEQALDNRMLGLPSGGDDVA